MIFLYHFTVKFLFSFFCVDNIYLKVNQMIDFFFFLQLKKSKKNLPKQYKFTSIGNILCMSQLLMNRGGLAGRSALRKARLHWQRTGPVHPTSYTDKINWPVSAPRTPRVKRARPSFKRILILIKIQYNQIKFNTYVNKISIISQLHQ